MSQTSLRVIPLGGLGRVGGNMMVYETDTDIMVVDCGVAFPRGNELGVDYVIPNISYLRQRREKLRGYVITHSHEDHVGALPYVLGDLPAPIFGTKYCLAHLRMKFGEHPRLSPELIQIHDGEELSVGNFRILPVPVTHSVVQAVALAITTPIGTVVHSGDFRIDPTPLDGRTTDLDTLRRLGGDGVTLLLSDSTNSEREGHTASENTVRAALTEVIGKASGRVLVTTFASNLHRLQAVIDASYASQRTVIPVGRSMTQAVQIGRENGFLEVPKGVLADATHVDNFTREQVTLLVSGSQGEARGSFSRIANGSHRAVRIERGDTVILSSRKIPGNELQISRVLNDLYRRGATVIDERTAEVHTSGHAYRDEQRLMLECLKPKWFIPIHGEYRHLVHHARTAIESGVPEEHVMLTEDGKPILFERKGEVVEGSRAPDVESSPTYVSGSVIGLLDDVVLSDRRFLAENGIVFCSLTVDANDKLVAGPQVTTRGLFHIDKNPSLVEEICDEVQKSLERLNEAPETLDGWDTVVKRALKRYFKRKHGVYPVLIPMVMRSESV